MSKSYVYQVTNKINNKIYVGVHHCEKVMQCNYWGSGVNLKRAIKKYGLNNFERKILFIYNTQGEALSKEKEIVTKEFADSLMTYNLSVGGNGQDVGYRLTEESRQKISNKLTGRKLTKEHRENIRKNGNFTRGLSQESYEKTRLKNLGTKRTIEQKLRMSIAQTKRWQLTNE